MEKGRISDSRKRKITKKVVLCKRCGTKTELVKVIGTHEVYKCPKCSQTTERWN